MWIEWWLAALRTFSISFVLDPSLSTHILIFSMAGRERLAVVEFGCCHEVMTTSWVGPGQNLWYASRAHHLQIHLEMCYTDSSSLVFWREAGDVNGSAPKVLVNMLFTTAVVASGMWLLSDANSVTPNLRNYRRRALFAASTNTILSQRIISARCTKQLSCDDPCRDRAG